MILSGKKTIELRSWSVKLRGDILVCVSKHGDASDGLPRGVALCVVRIVDIRAATQDDAQASCCGVPDGCFAWVLEDVRPVQAFPVKGNARLFTVIDADIHASSA